MGGEAKPLRHHPALRGIGKKQLILIGGVVAFFVIAPLTGMGSTQDGDINDDFSLGDHRHGRGHRHQHEHHHAWDAGGLNERFVDAVRPTAEAWIHDHVHLQFGEREDGDENAGLPRYVTQMQHAKDSLSHASKDSLSSLSQAVRNLDKIERDFDSHVRRGDAAHRSDDIPSVAAHGSVHSAVDWMRNILPRAGAPPVVDASLGADTAVRRFSRADVDDVDDDADVDADSSTHRRSRAASKTSTTASDEVRTAERPPGEPTCEKCGHRGVCVDSGCSCAAVWEGRGCKTTRSLGARAPGVVSGFKRGFSGAILTTRANAPDTIEIHENPAAHSGMKRIGKLSQSTRERLPEEDPLDGVSFARCAVVGGGGSLLAATYGAEIDAHDAVFRFDKHPTVGYETHVGRKTTHRVVDGAAVGFRERDSETVLQSYRTTRAFKQFLSRKRRAPSERLHAIHPDFLAWVHESFALAPATEMIGVVVAAHRCREVNLYGFQIQSFDGVKDKYHEKEDGRDADSDANADADADAISDLDRRAGADDSSSEGAPERHSEMDGDEWLALKAMATHGVVNFAEPCVVRCHESASECDACREAEARLTSDDDRDARRGGGGGGGSGFGSAVGARGDVGAYARGGEGVVGPRKGGLGDSLAGWMNEVGDALTHSYGRGRRDEAAAGGSAPVLDAGFDDDDDDGLVDDADDEDETETKSASRSRSRFDDAASSSSTGRARRHRGSTGSSTSGA